MPADALSKRKARRRGLLSSLPKSSVSISYETGLQRSAGQFRKRLSLQVVFSLFIIFTDGELMRFLRRCRRHWRLALTRYILGGWDEVIRFAPWRTHGKNLKLAKATLKCHVLLKFKTSQKEHVEAANALQNACKSLPLPESGPWERKYTDKAQNFNNERTK